MATTKTSMSARKSTAKKSNDAMTEEQNIVAVQQDQPAKPERKRPTAKNIPLTDLVCVKSCFYGTLTYISKKTGSIIEWNDFDAEQYLSVEELMYMRNTQPAFFKEQWIRLVGDNADDVFDFLHLERYCKTSFEFESFGDVFSLPVSEIESTISAFSDSMKESFARFAMECVQNGSLESLSIIHAIEHATGFDLLN